MSRTNDDVVGTVVSAPSRQQQRIAYAAAVLERCEPIPESSGGDTKNRTFVSVWLPSNKHQLHVYLCSGCGRPLTCEKPCDDVCYCCDSAQYLPKPLSDFTMQEVAKIWETKMESLFGFDECTLSTEGMAKDFLQASLHVDRDDIRDHSYGMLLQVYNRQWAGLLGAPLASLDYDDDTCMTVYSKNKVWSFLRRGDAYNVEMQGEEAFHSGVYTDTPGATFRAPVPVKVVPRDGWNTTILQDYTARQVLQHATQHGGEDSDVWVLHGRKGRPP